MWKINQNSATMRLAKGEMPLVVLLATVMLVLTALSVAAAVQGIQARQQASAVNAVAEASAIGDNAAVVEQNAAEQTATTTVAADDPSAGSRATLTSAPTPEASSPTPSTPSAPPTPSAPSTPAPVTEEQEVEAIEEAPPISELSESEVLALSDETVVENAAEIAGSQEVGDLIAQTQTELGRDFTDEELELLSSGLKAQYAYDQALAEGRAATQQFTSEEQAVIDDALAATDEGAVKGGGFAPLISSGSRLTSFYPGGKYSPGVGEYPTTKGKILATADWYINIIPTGHAALVIDATSAYTSLSNGVTVEPNDWYDPNRHQTAFGLDVTKTNAAQEAKATDWCAQHLGKPYNYLFVLPQRTDAYYCSSLIWQAYQKTCNVNLNTSAWTVLGFNIMHPMELVDSPQTTLLYRQGTARTGWQTVNGTLYYVDAKGNASAK
jgi:cytoskeletal protein RodZ